MCPQNVSTSEPLPLNVDWHWEKSGTPPSIRTSNHFQSICRTQVAWDCMCLQFTSTRLHMQSSRSIYSFAPWNRPAYHFENIDDNSMTWKSFTSFSTFVSDHIRNPNRIVHSAGDLHSLRESLPERMIDFTHSLHPKFRKQCFNYQQLNQTIRFLLHQLSPGSLSTFSTVTSTHVPDHAFRISHPSFKLLFSSPASGSIFLIIKSFAMSQSTPSPSDPTFPSDRPEFRKWSYFTPPSQSQPWLKHF